MKKRIISRLLSSVLALSVFMALTGCDGNINININNVPSSTQEEAPAAEEEEPAEEEAPSDAPVCPFCGEVTEPDAKFCVYCGKPLE